MFIIRKILHRQQGPLFKRKVSCSSAFRSLSALGKSDVTENGLPTVTT